MAQVVSLNFHQTFRPEKQYIAAILEKGKDSIIHGIQWIQQYKLIVDERCFKTKEELENYTWKKDKKTGEYINEPVDTYNHTIDSIRYGLNKYIKGIMKPVIRDKAEIGVVKTIRKKGYWDQ